MYLLFDIFSHFLIYFDVPPKEVEKIYDEYKRDIDILKATILKPNISSKQNCTFHEEMLPPPYRYIYLFFIIYNITYIYVYTYTSQLLYFIYIDLIFRNCWQWQRSGIINTNLNIIVD